MLSVVSVNPFRCRVWMEHVRMEEFVTEFSCRNEIASLQSQGQLIPALGRRIQGDPNHDIELIYGARRLYAARQLNIPINVEVRDLSDRDAAIALDIENNQRQSLSHYERGVGYSRWLRAGMFSSQDDLARTLGVSKAQVSRLLTLSKLPPVIVNAFPSPLEICETWAPELYAAWCDPAQKPQLAAKARRLANLTPKLSAVETFAALFDANAAGLRKGRARDEVFAGQDGRPLFRVRFSRQTIAILLPHSTSSKSIELVKGAILKALAEANELQGPARARSATRHSYPIRRRSASGSSNSMPPHP